jgi:hypothetical protein
MEFVSYLPGWHQTAILLTSASKVARITGVSHGNLVRECSFLFDEGTGFSLSIGSNQKI